MKPIEQTVCIATEETKNKGYNVPEGFTGKYGYFFTKQELNEYIANVIKQALETAAEIVENELEKDFLTKESITNTFEQTYKKFEV